MFQLKGCISTVLYSIIGQACISEESSRFLSLFDHVHPFIRQRPRTVDWSDDSSLLGYNMIKLTALGLSLS